MEIIKEVQREEILIQNKPKFIIPPENKPDFKEIKMKL
jgi:hypothetical protein